MKAILSIIITLLLLASCSESVYDGTRIPSLNKRYLYVRESSLLFNAQSHSEKVSIESDQTDWKIEIPTNWISVSQTSGNNSTFVNFSTQQNNSADTSRVCVVTIVSDVNNWHRSFPITVTQEKNTPYINITEKSVVCSANTQNLSILIDTNTEYTIDNTGEDWLQIESATASELKINIEENNTDDERTAFLTIKSKLYKGVSSTVSVRQKKANITSTKEMLSFGHSSASQTIEIESEASWNASSTSWISISPTSGYAGTTEVTISVPNNASINSRNGSVYFNIAGKNSIEVPIEQEGVVLNISCDNITFDSFESTESVKITSNDSWVIVSKPEWINISSTSGRENETISITTKENNTTKPRNGEIVITTAENINTKTIHVVQAAKHVDYSDATLTYSYGGGAQNISFSTDAHWSLTKDADWFSVDKTSGKGSATLTINVTENNSIHSRQGTISLVIADQTFTISIVQNCKYLTLSSSGFTFSADPGKTKLTVESNTQWTARIIDGEEWIAISPDSGTDNAELSINVKENKTITSRSGKIELEIPNVQTYIIDVLQNRKYIKTDMSSIDFLHSGGQISFNVTTDGTYEVSKIGRWFGFVKSGDCITVIAQENTNSESRTGAIVLKMTNLEGGGYSVMIPVTQSSN